MPRGDRTGPGGLGPMTGRAAGFCAGYDVPGYANPLFGRGAGSGFGFRGGGRGWRNRYYATGIPGRLSGFFADPAIQIDKELQIEQLKEQARIMEKQLDLIKQRTAELNQESDKNIK